MTSSVFRFNERWEIPNASVDEVYEVLARGELLPLWCKGVYLEAEKLSKGDEPKVGDRVRALGFPADQFIRQPEDASKHAHLTEPSAKASHEQGARRGRKVRANKQAS